MNLNVTPKTQAFFSEYPIPTLNLTMFKSILPSTSPHAMIYPVEVEYMQHTRQHTNSNSSSTAVALPRRRSTSSTRSQQSLNFSRPHPASPVRRQSPNPTNRHLSPPLPLSNTSPISHQIITVSPKPYKSALSSRGRTRAPRKMATYFLTGANRGIGLEFVRQLSAKPTNTIIAGVRSKSADLSDLEALNTHSNIHIVECDVSSLDSLSGLEFRVAEILTKSGSNLDFLFNVAGINATSTDTSLTLDPQSLHDHMQTNVLGPAKIVQSLKRYLARGATVMNVSSGLGSLTVATDVTKCCTYSMSKAALNMLTLHQAKDLKNGGVKVITMDPGWVSFSFLFSLPIHPDFEEKRTDQWMYRSRREWVVKAQ